MHKAEDDFNRGRYFEAHESFEAYWLTLGNSEEDDIEIIIRGFVQLAAGLHQIGQGRPGKNNLNKGISKLLLAINPIFGADLRDFTHKMEQYLSGKGDIPLLLFKW